LSPAVVAGVVVTGSTLGNRRWEGIVLADFGAMLTGAGWPPRDRLRDVACRLETLTEFADPEDRGVQALL
jgi:hypothetical protein